MLKKIKNIMLAIALPLALAAPVALAGGVSAGQIGDCNNGIRGSINQGVNSASNSSASCDLSGGSANANGLQEIAAKVVNLLSVIVGIAAVVMIIVGGFRYIASGGASDKVSGAKNTLIYAIVGLVIVALAQFIVRFVLDNVGV